MSSNSEIEPWNQTDYPPEDSEVTRVVILNGQQIVEGVRLPFAVISFFVDKLGLAERRVQVVGQQQSEQREYSRCPISRAILRRARVQENA